jgi:pilus assembly protein CpaC
MRQPVRCARVPLTLTIILLSVLTNLQVAGSSLAADFLDRVKTQRINQVLHLQEGLSRVLRTPFAISRISVADPEIADVMLISDREIYINGLAPGVTNISVWGKSRFTSAKVIVEADLTLLKDKLHEILPTEKISVKASGDSVVLTGEVSGPIAQQTALALALPFAGNKKEKVVNLLHIGGVQQVMVEVRLAEINRSVARRIGVNAVILNKNGQDFGVTTLNNLTSITDFVRNFGGTSLSSGLSPNLTAVAGWTTGSVLWTMFFDLLKQQGLGRILAEPNLVTTSGQEASFLAGGEYPIPVPQSGIGGSGVITIEYKKFGVALTFTPTVLDDGKIAMKVSPEVSQLDFTAGVAFVAQGYVVPGLSVRRTSTHVELRDGETFAIAGLLNDSSRTVVDKYPILGDLPVLGALFRSSQYQKNETELVVLATPHLVKPTTVTATRLPTDKYVDPNDLEFYLLGCVEGKKKTQPQPEPVPVNELTPEFGHQTLK